MHLDELATREEGDEGMDGRDITRESAQWRAAVYARLGTTSKRTERIESTQMVEFAEIKRKMRWMESELRRLRSAPAAIIGAATARGSAIVAGTPNQGQDLRPATLSPNPKTFSVLWDEYVNGISGRLPARKFSRGQRGKCKASYCQRKVFWDCVVRQIDAGKTYRTAIAEIEEIYGHLGSMSKMLVALRKDERRGGHCRLNPTSLRADRTATAPVTADPTAPATEAPGTDLTATATAAPGIDPTATATTG